MAVVKTYLILTMTALDFVVMARSVGPNQFVADIEFGGSLFKQRRKITLAVRESVCELRIVICLHTFDIYTQTRKLANDTPQKVR
jgi:hypothetical protein